VARSKRRKEERMGVRRWVERGKEEEGDVGRERIYVEGNEGEGAKEEGREGGREGAPFGIVSVVAIPARHGRAGHAHAEGAGGLRREGGRE
jgi:hypothetical protein